MSLFIERAAEDPQFDPAPLFHRRLRYDRETTARLEKYGELWHRTTGNYNSDPNVMVNLSTLPCDIPDTPPTFHRYLKSAVERLRNIKPVGMPVVILDIGGGEGQTWSAVASNFKEEIALGEIAFVVSNLIWSPERFANSNAPLPDRNLVHYVQSSFGRLPDVNISLPNGQNVPLVGNVDIAHESYSLTCWSQVPELDVPTVGMLLSETGTYFIAPKNAPLLCKESLADSIENQEQRSRGLRMARSYMEYEYNVNQVRRVEGGDFRGGELLYTAYKKLNAPRIDL